MQTSRALPWILASLSILVALYALSITALTACGELPGAYRDGVTTEARSTLILLADTCEITRGSDGVVNSRTIVNWSGIVFAISVVVGAWFVGATLGGQISRRRGLTGIALASAGMLGAAASFFA